MKIFQTIRKQYAILGIGPSNQSTQKYSFNKRIPFGFLLLGCGIISHFVYIFHVANGFMEYVASICSTSGSLIMFVCFATIVFRKTTQFGCFENIENLIDIRSKYPKSKRFFLKTNRQVEQLSEIVFGLVAIFLQLIMIPICFVSFGIYFITDSGSESFKLPIPFWFPFDSANPIGYLIAMILEYILFGYGYFVIASTLGLGIGAYWLAISATKEIQRISRLINEKAHAKGNQGNELKILFSELVETHGIVKHLENDFSDIFQPILMSLFTWSLLAISSAFLMIQMEIMHRGDVMTLLVPFIDGLIGLATVFIACELGQRMAEAFEEIDDTIDQFDWYLFPIEIQRTLPIIILIVQQAVELECFGSIACTREVFKNVLHRAYSYFMVLRQLGV